MVKEVKEGQEASSGSRKVKEAEEGSKRVSGSVQSGHELSELKRSNWIKGGSRWVKRGLRGLEGSKGVEEGQ